MCVRDWGQQADPAAFPNCVLAQLSLECAIPRALIVGTS